MSNPADCTIGGSVQVKQIYNMVKYESLSVYQIKNVKSCWLYYRCLCTSKTYTTWLNMNHCQYIKYKMSNPADSTTGASVQVKINNMVKYESLSVYQIQNVKSCWLYYRWLCTSKKNIQHG
jgi:hypothetical protein